MRTLPLTKSAASLLLLTPLCLTASAQLRPQADRVVASADSGGRVAVPGHLPAWTSTSPDIGLVPADTELRLTFVLSRAPEVQAAFTQLLADQQNESSPRYHQWLTPQQVGEQYGPTQHDVDALSGWLTRQGFSLAEVAPSRVFVTVTAPSATAARALGTSFHYFRLGGASRFAAVSEPALPSNLAPVVASIAGLADVPVEPQHRMTLVAPPPAGIAAPSPLYTSASSGNHYIAPGDFASLFNIAQVYNSGYNGTGQKVAIVGRSRVVLADISTFESQTGLPTNAANVVVPPSGADPGVTGDGNQGEATLDVQRVIGVAPGVQADLVVASSASGGISTAAQYIVNTLNDPVMSISFGACEVNGGSAGVNYWDTLFQQAAAQGISVLVSSGDSGAATCDAAFAAAPATQVRSINYICSSSYATCVGGTELIDTLNPSLYWSSSNSASRSSVLGYVPEGAWNEFSVTTGGVTSYQVGGGGGGSSVYISKPSWQTGFGVPADGARDVPDMSFPAAGHDGYYGCYTAPAPNSYPCSAGYFYGFAGTSAAAPGMAGVVALVNQKTGTRQGNLNPKLYKLAASTANNVFHDTTVATSGVTSCSAGVPSLCNNSTPSASALTGGLAGYLLTPGYDLVTGWGSIDVANYVGTVGKTFLPTATALVANPTTVNVGQSITLTATVTGSTVTPTGTVQFLSNGVYLGTPVAMTGGVATLTGQSFAATGTYVITAAYSGDTTFAGSVTPAVSLIVTNPSSSPSTSTLTASMTSATTAQMVSFNDVVTGTKGTATGTVRFTVDGVTGAANTLAAGSFTLPAALYTAGSHTVSATYSGDTNYSPSTSNAVTLVVTSSSKPSTSVLTITPATITSTGTTTVAVTVSGSFGTPTGNVNLLVGTTAFASGTLTAGTISGPISGFSPGTYAITASYDGDTVYGPSTSNAVTLTVTGGGSGTVTLTPAATSLTQAAGGTSTDVITLTDTNFAGTEYFSCSVIYNGSGTPTNVPTCSFNPASVALTGSGTATSTLTVYSVAGTASTGGSNFASSHRLDLEGLGGAALAALLLGFLPRRGRRTLKAARVLSAVLFLATLAALSGCGGSGTATSNPHTLGTTKGSYDVLINANSALNQAGNVGYSGTVHLTVQ